ncbi:hypothetical protein CDEST_00771 [Colletotrichum destructivum]|uniref:Uncharacterized protein n=1 Tax=Colletotrichum destructivum TaxID=34406 RepID=A0AAX4HXG2_9PEZI|nr:hypothetical protein CDEST_00771 [Colletotrichum destructivum]
MRTEQAAHALLFSQADIKKAYMRASARSWILFLCKKGSYGICSEGDLRLFFPFGIGLGRTLAVRSVCLSVSLSPSPLSRTAIICGMSQRLPQSLGRNSAVHPASLIRECIPGGCSNWARVTGRQR